MGKVWSVLFGIVLLACFGLFVAAPFIPGWWLPGNLSPYGGDVDNLYYLILGMTGFFFVLTEVILVYNMWQFGHQEGRKSEYIHGSHRLEVFWTAVPAVLLILIAVLQIGTWERIKYQARMPEPNQILQVTGRQWEWRIRYPVPAGLDAVVEKLDRLDSAEERRKEADAFKVLPVASPRGWAEHPEADDIHLVNELHTWKNVNNNGNVKIYLQTADVIHSLFLPNLRLKQDALPGKTIPMWFAVSESNLEYDEEAGLWRSKDRPGLTYEFACAELCGARHYAMRGRLCVHEDKADYLRWLHRASRLHKSTMPEDRKSVLTVLVDR